MLCMDWDFLMNLAAVSCRYHRTRTLGGATDHREASLALNGLPVSPLPYRRHIVPIGPKLPTPKVSISPLAFGRQKISRAVRLLKIWTIRPGAHFRTRTAEEMNMMLFRPNRFPLDRKTLRNLSHRLLDIGRQHLM